MDIDNSLSNVGLGTQAPLVQRDVPRTRDIAQPSQGTDAVSDAPQRQRDPSAFARGVLLAQQQSNEPQISSEARQPKAQRALEAYTTLAREDKREELQRLLGVDTYA
ncbi:hypothetical protein LJ739_08425 [Aestuariibacter halophilus]|uniref:Uncharacterized protein n=1 Tax=Fluctibacter halophilus TaxID=226011 RepID=A0ABS8G770_9ALTE|nr:hypothetical protein [Aestuariibacter halophilus]MCC2616263.1 hypothetical protein [Aestuariibacter halophilus]